MAVGPGSCSCRTAGLLVKPLVSSTRCCFEHLRRLLCFSSIRQLFTYCPFSRIFRSEEKRPTLKVRILLVGRRYAGKTALVYRLKLGSFIPTKPSVGLNEECFTIQFPALQRQQSLPFDAGEYSRSLLSRASEGREGVRVTLCDVAGGDGHEIKWQGIQKTCACVCFVLDSTLPASNLDDVRREMLELFYDEHFVLNRSSPFLIIASKADLKGARPATDIQALLDLPEDMQPLYRIMSCSSLSGDGIPEILRWIVHAAVSCNMHGCGGVLEYPHANGRPLVRSKQAPPFSKIPVPAALQLDQLEELKQAIESPETDFGSVGGRN